MEKRFENNKQIVESVLDSQAKNLVGILLKRIEVLAEEKALTPNLYKALTKEIIYEQFRNIKKLLDVHFSIGKLNFKSKDR